ncbi:hypothetical protein Riv7116_4735 [Rivularia sp. PCC 7116]|uniref:hypothetical protein n=1 Tax=Rivularia sp. PCC 7116 TaxID=373994 RepID=UPI00029F3FC5|nr:hypothetical protein [Rivularia sp. PCC 7116]AFY57149.1 hypothetical protein Riv7116_4735 [Rivularia sp. PCC 7116]
MSLQFLTSNVVKIGRFLAIAMFCLSATLGFFSNNVAIAANNPTLIASGIAGDAKSKASEDAQNTKGFIEDVKNQVQRTASNNADRVENATDGSGNFLERKANRDAVTIQRRAEEDAARTKGAVDATKNAVKGAVNDIKDTLD